MHNQRTAHPARYRHLPASVVGFGLLGAVLAAPLAAQSVSIELVSRRAFLPGDWADAEVVHRSLSPDGRYVAVAALATNLSAGIVDRNAGADAYRFDLEPANGA